MLRLFLLVVASLTVAKSFVPNGVSINNNNKMKLRMVRNIDLPEALVFYGWEALLDESSSKASLKPGVDSLLDECKDVNTAVLLIVPQEEFDAESIERRSEAMASTDLQLVVAEQPAPNPRALLESLEAILVQPKGFGGSSGFGRKAADPERSPVPKHVVVLATTEEQCLAARYVGTRVVCLAQDNDFADAIVDGWDEFGLDDISTPGSYWLNPPHPSDGYGNKINIDSVIEQYEGGKEERKPFMSIDSRNSVVEKYEGERDEGGKTEERKPFVSIECRDMEDDDISRILADLDPL